MKKILLMAAVLFTTSAVSAQGLKEGKLSNVTRITNDAVAYENARWSPDGSKIAFTQFDYDGLFVMNADGTNQRQISTDTGVGYKYEWSADSKEILVRDTRWLDNSGKRVHAAWALDLNGKKTRMTEDAEYMQPASWRYSATGIKSVVATGAKSVHSQIEALPRTMATRVTKLPQYQVSFTCDINGDNLYKVDAIGVKTLINEGPSYCAVLSPDGKKVAFNQVDDVVVMNIDGTGKTIIGQGFNATWVNNEQILFEKTTDDGHEYTSGELYIAKADGTSVKAITSSSLIEMQPQLSPDGTKLIFVSYTDGQIYMADFK